MDLHGGAPTSLISTDYSGTKRATGDPQVSKRPYFQGFFRFPKRLNCLISVFLYFSIFWISVSISETKRATGDPQVSKQPDFLGLFRFPKKIIFGFLYFCTFLDFWPYLRNKKSYWRSAGVKRAGFPKKSNFWISEFLYFCIFHFWNCIGRGF